MVWVCIKSEVKRKFVKADGDLNSENYISLLRSNFLGYKDGEISQHDGTRCHISRATKSFMNEYTHLLKHPPVK